MEKGSIWIFHSWNVLCAGKEKKKEYLFDRKLIMDLNRFIYMYMVKDEEKLGR